MRWEDVRPAGASHTVLMVHGGPGSQRSPRLCEQVLRSGPFRVIAYDQRGCGDSTPRGSLAANTTQDLMDDIESLRRHLEIDRWLVVGGSWGATLALAYAGQHGQAISGLVLRGLFVPDEHELKWVFQGAREVNQTAWENWRKVAPRERLDQLVPWLADVFAGNDLPLQTRVVHAWQSWERALAGTDTPVDRADVDLTLAIDRYRVQAHYLACGCWMKRDELATIAAKLQGVPALFLHGELDQLCRMDAARNVQAHLAGSEWRTIVGAGHDPFHPAMVEALQQGLASFAANGCFRSLCA